MNSPFQASEKYCLPAQQHVPAASEPNAVAPATTAESRRFALKSFAASVASLAAGCSGCGGGGNETEVSPTPPAVSPSPPPASPSPSPPPASPPPPPPPSGAVPTTPAVGPAGPYRYSQSYLFSSVTKASEPSRLPGGSPLNLDLVGPHREYVDFGTGWRWRNAGGDWIDKNQVRMGTAPWVSVLTNAVSGSAIGSNYQGDVTAAVQLVQTAGRWNAWIVRDAPTSTAPRVLAGRFNASEAWRPAIDVTYSDGSTAVLACRVSALLVVGLNQPSSTSPELQLPCALEFDRPTKAVRQATLRFRVTQHWDGRNPALEFYLADPPVNGDPITNGVAQGFPLDAGLSAHSSIIGQHRYHDGSRYSDWVYTDTSPIGPLNFDESRVFDPALWGGATDTRTLPHIGLGKWLGSWNGGGAELVTSAYTGENFLALAPGIGALKVKMDKAGGIADGVEGGQNGSGGANSFIFLPVDRYGRQRRMFVRYYMRLGSRHRTPYRVSLADKLQVLKLGVPTWTDMAGKCSIGSAHKTALGGNSGSAGAGRGWTLRQEFSDYWFDENSPNAEGWGRSFSFYDYQNNVPGHNYASEGDRALTGLGQRGGLGSTIYADRWYCIEEEINLNSVDRPAMVNGSPHLVNGVQQFWTPDGEARVWIDGRLAFERTGVVLRSLPLATAPSGQMGGVRELGIAHLWFNWFHGGLTRNSIDRVVFITGLAYGDAYIGPMKI